MLKIDCQKKISKDFCINAKFEIEKNDFVCLYGKSGSGKTTILRIIAGFIKPDCGEIWVEDKEYFSKNIFLPPQKRDVGILFQDYALFENMNVIKNLLFAKNDINLAKRLLKLVELEEFENRKIQTLSGGQKQRVALARALMRAPKILLLDEPFSALDKKISRKLQDYLLKIKEEFQMTIILVTHNVEEIYNLCTKVYEVKNAKVLPPTSVQEKFLQSSGSKKFSFMATILKLEKRDTIFVATINLANQINEVVLSPIEAQNLNPGDEVILSAKAYGLNIKRI